MTGNTPATNHVSTREAIARASSRAHGARKATLLFVAILSACGESPTVPEGSPAVRIDRTVFQPGTSGELTLVPLAIENLGARAVWVRGCPPRLLAAVETNEGNGRWKETVRWEPPCDGFTEVPAGATVRFEVPVPPPGQHRVRISLETPDPQPATQLYSPPFLVLGTGAVQGGR